MSSTLGVGKERTVHVGGGTVKSREDRVGLLMGANGTGRACPLSRGKPLAGPRVDPTWRKPLRSETARRNKQTTPALLSTHSARDNTLPLPTRSLQTV